MRLKQEYMLPKKDDKAVSTLKGVAMRRYGARN
jgi:hypothetical protein